MVEARQQQNREAKKYGKRTSNPRRSDFTNTALLSRLTVIYIIIIMVQQDDPGMPAIHQNLAAIQSPLKGRTFFGTRLPQV
jgi:hypothetical protein